MSSDEEIIGSFGYGFKVTRRTDGRIEFQPATVIKDVPIEFIIMQMQVYLDDLKREYHERHTGKSSSPKNGV